jgi:predicted lactoylglutathione lyase
MESRSAALTGPPCAYIKRWEASASSLGVCGEEPPQVEVFYRAALEAGGRDNGPPGLRPQYSGKYYAAFAIGPDGHNIEAVYHEPEA